MEPAYEWDEAKAASNLAKHGVSFLDATEVFEDPHGLIWTSAALRTANCGPSGWASSKAGFWQSCTRCAAMCFG